jgi:hypothetical protein
MPTFVGNFSADGYTHDVQVVNYLGPDNAYVGQEIVTPGQSMPIKARCRTTISSFSWTTNWMRSAPIL